MSAGAAPRIPSAARYVAQRWAELTDASGPWWSRAVGLGVRLRLRELLDMADARQQGSLIEETIVRLRREALKVLITESDFLKTRFAAVAGQLRDALADSDRADQFVPGGRNYSAIEAVLAVLSADVLVAALCAEIAERADGAADWTDLVAIDEIVELLDAELAFAGHSRQWRARVADDVLARVTADPPEELAVALPAAIEAAREDWPHDVQFLFRATLLSPRKVEEVSGSYRDAGEVEEILHDWKTVPATDELGNGAFELSVSDASDLDAALERAEGWAEQQVSTWRLQGGDVRLHPDVMYYDRTADDAQVRERPEPLWLVPDNLRRFKSRLEKEPPRGADTPVATLEDALVQLSQARSAAPGPALADLWGVAEAVFAGTATESRFDAGPVMAELAEFLYPLERLEWLAARFERHFGPRPAGTPPGAWVFDVLREHGGKVFSAFEDGDDDPLGWVRLKSFASWPDTERLGVELDWVNRRGEMLCDRAYLVRNFFVHRAQPYRARALAVTLPVFAELLRVCLGFIAADDDRVELPIAAAKAAMLRLRAAAEYFDRVRSGDFEADEAVLRRACGF